MRPSDCAGASAGDQSPRLAVGLYSPAWPPSQFANGVISYTGTVAEGMRRLGHDVRLLTPRLVEGAGDEGGFPVLDLTSEVRGVMARIRNRIDQWRGGSRPSIRSDWIGRALRSASGRWVSRNEPRILEMEESFGWARCVSDRVPLVVRLHGPWFINGPNQGAGPEDPDFVRRVRLEGEAIRAAAGITSPSRFVLDRTRAYYGMALEQAEVIPNPVREVSPKDRWSSDQCEPDRLLFVGRFDRTKGGDVMIDAFAELLRSRPNARLTFVGPDSGLPTNGRPVKLAEYVERRLPGALSDGRIDWLGRRSPEEIAPLRRKAAVTVVASRNENFPMSLVEAMAVGSPLVATRAGGAAEAFEHGSHGLYVDPEDASGLASAIGSLLMAPDRSASLGRAAAAYCEAHYAPDRVAARTIDFYRRTMARAEGPRRGIQS